MHYLLSTTNDPHFNIACEEYFLKSFKEDIFFLYVNSPSIIIGKHQNALAEINLDFIQENNIPVVRRLSGGGTVFHDLGNLNFCFIQNVSNTHEISFRHFTQPIVDALASMGINAVFSQRNDLLVENRKVSGNAMHIFKNRIISHGTLLYQSELTNLSGALQSSAHMFQDNAVRSNRSRVANISDYMTSPLPVNQFIQNILKFLKANNDSMKSYTLTKEDIAAVNKLKNDKYEKWDWNFGYSPKYSITKAITIGEEDCQITLKIKKGIIENCSLLNHSNLTLKQSIESTLTGIEHRLKTVEEVMKKENLQTILEARTLF